MSRAVYPSFGDGRLVLGLGREFREAPLFSEHGERSPVSDGQEPGFEAPGRVVAVEAAEDLEEGLLANILGVLPVADDVEGHGKDQVPESLHPRPGGNRAPPQAAFDDLSFV